MFDHRPVVYQRDFNYLACYSNILLQMSTLLVLNMCAYANSNVVQIQIRLKVWYDDRIEYEIRASDLEAHFHFVTAIHIESRPLHARVTFSSLIFSRVSSLSYIRLERNELCIAVIALCATYRNIRHSDYLTQDFTNATCTIV